MYQLRLLILIIPFRHIRVFIPKLQRLHYIHISLKCETKKFSKKRRPQTAKFTFVRASEII